ncbi:MAG: serine/threonine protein kinase [Leptolyngbya sp. IPPAS B-1204]|nr:serine/threonine protein kinase [Elainella sp. C42_A2020_010]
MLQTGMLQTGQVLQDRYQIQQMLGKKPGRQTFQALDRQTQQPVILKLLIFGGDIEWDHFKLFEREGQVLQSLEHPAIPKYLDTFELDLPQCRGFVLVQSYIDAPSLQAHLQMGRTFSPQELKQLAESLLQILIYLHQRHPAIVHRDLKPSNILLSCERSGHWVGQVYLIDFGSVQSAAATREGTFTVVGTYGYTAPEQFGGRAVPASDLYSLGATLIYLATGRHPAELPLQAGRIQFEAVAQLSSAFCQWLVRMVEPSLDRRFDSAQAALTALRTCKLDAPVGLHHQLDNSRISLSISPDQLQVVVPPKHNFFTAMRYLSGTTALRMLKTLPIVLLVSLLLQLPILGWFLLFGYRHQLLTALSRIWQEYRFPELRQLRLYIDQYEISLIHELLGVRVEFLGSAPRRELVRLERIQSHTVQAKKATGEPFISAIEPAVVLRTRHKTFELKGLTEREADWLAETLSEWLGLSLQQ